MLNRKNFFYIKEKKYEFTENNLKAATSISGIPHIGNAKDVIITDTVRKALDNINAKSKFYWIADDFDPLRKVPSNLDSAKFSQYLGMPVSEIPCPENCCKSYNHHFISLFKDSFKDLDINPKVIWMSKLYQSGDFYDEIITAIRNRDKLREILNKYRENKLDEDWVPWNAICENCGKLITTKVISINEDVISYKCQGYSFKHITLEGCGYEGNYNLRKGIGKMPYRTEAAAQWKHFKITFEPWGKEHATKPGGTLWVNGEISEYVYNWPMPSFMIYEFILVDDQKMSSSRGNIITVNKWLQYAPPETLKYFCLRNPKSQTNVSLGNLPKLIDEYDDLVKTYFEVKELTKKIEKKIKQLKKTFEFCQGDSIPTSIPIDSYLPYSIAVVISQFSLGKFDDLISILEAQNIKINILTEADKDLINNRLKLANNWVKDFGPERLKFAILEDLPENLDLKAPANIRNALQELAQIIKTQDITANDLNARIHDVSTNNDLNSNEFFELLYYLFIGKKSGPRLAKFILMLLKYKGKNWVINRLNQES